MNLDQRARGTCTAAFNKRERDNLLHHLADQYDQR